MLDEFAHLLTSAQPAFLPFFPFRCADRVQGLMPGLMGGPALLLQCAALGANLLEPARYLM